MGRSCCCKPVVNHNFFLKGLCKHEVGQALEDDEPSRPHFRSGKAGCPVAAMSAGKDLDHRSTLLRLVLVYSCRF